MPKPECACAFVSYHIHYNLKKMFIAMESFIPYKNIFNHPEKPDVFFIIDVDLYCSNYPTVYVCFNFLLCQLFSPERFPDTPAGRLVSRWPQLWSGCRWAARWTSSVVRPRSQPAQNRPAKGFRGGGRFKGRRKIALYVRFSLRRLCIYCMAEELMHPTGIRLQPLCLASCDFTVILIISKWSRRKDERNYFLPLPTWNTSIEKTTFYFSPASKYDIRNLIKTKIEPTDNHELSQSEHRSKHYRSTP